MTSSSPNSNSTKPRVVAIVTFVDPPASNSIWLLKTLDDATPVRSRLTISCRFQRHQIPTIRSTITSGSSYLIAIAMHSHQSVIGLIHVFTYPKNQNMKHRLI